MEKLTTVVTSIQNITNYYIENYCQSSSSSDDEEDILNVIEMMTERGPMILKPRVKNYIENVVALLSNEGFKEHFRMLRDTFNFLLNIVKPQLQKKQNCVYDQRPGRNTIDPEKQLLIIIWTFATPDSYRSVCDRFGVGNATAWRAIKRVVHALINLRTQYIKWPTEEEAMESARIFETKKGFPGVIGAIDGTHIKIEAPKENQESYINRKGYHSIQLQVVCNHKMELIHCYVGYPGSVHDQRVFHVSGLQDFCNDPTKFPNNTHLIGDAAYTILKTLLVPYRDNGQLTERNKNFNYCLSSTRMVVERCIGLLKARFRILLDKLPMKRTDLIPKYIMACCVLHNICIIRNDMIDIPLIVEDVIQNNVKNININNLLHIQGKEKRDRIKDTLCIKL